VVSELPAPEPSPTLDEPVVLLESAPAPSAVLLMPVVLLKSA
jgi:hypothetical protein